MTPTATAIAIFKTHDAAEDGARRLATAGFDLETLTIVGKGYHTEKQIIGFYNIGDRVSFWGQRGAYWGALWGLFFSGVRVVAPPVGSVVFLGHLAASMVAAIEGAALSGGASALGDALFSIGTPKDSVLAHEAAVTADQFLVMALGAVDDLARAKTVLAAGAVACLDLHQDAPG